MAVFMNITGRNFGPEPEGFFKAHWTALREKGANVPLGRAALGWNTSDLGFVLSDDALPNVLGAKKVDVPNACAVRVDEVAFPLDAIAHRHTHVGSGWRFLVSGALQIETNESIRIVYSGDSWFEHADNPVRAVALHKTGVTRFVRFMIIPASFVGRSTFQLCQPSDAELPRLQITHRHFDHILQKDP